MADVALPVLSVVATVLTIAFFLASLPTARRIRQSRTSASVAFMPYVAGVVSCTLWLKYGLLVRDRTVIIVNGTGFLLNAFYLYTCYIFTKDPDAYKVPVSVAAIVVYGCLTYVKFFLTDYESALQFSGLVACTASIIMFGSPLASVAKVLRTRSTESMVFSLCFMGFVMSVAWSLYAYLIGDLFMLLPNAIGALLSTLQLLLFVKFPSSGGPGHVYDVAARLI